MKSEQHFVALEHVSCALCGADEPLPFLRKDGFSVVRCSNCDLVYVDPRPAPTAVRSLYQEASYFRGDEWYLDYIGYEKNHRALFRRVVAILDRHCPGKGRLVDVGCAAGFLLDTARAKGWTVTGVDLSATMAHHAVHALGLDVRLGTLEECRLPEASFDAVTLCDSLEHVLNPLATMREVRRILRPGGIALIVTPNIASPLARLLGTRWPHLTPREHIYYFARHSLRRLIATAGFERVEDGTIGHYFTLEYIGRKLAPFLGPTLRLPLLARSINLSVGDLLMVARRGVTKKVVSRTPSTTSPSGSSRS
jgi:2-polyprenyl-3-methyl-5-hydroxy-6-metoxy-1,4-benzoquinol methylase